MTGPKAISHESIKALLAAEVEEARAQYQAIAAEFRILMDIAPSERPNLAVLFPPTALEEEKSAAIKALCDAIRRYDNFLLRAEFPKEA